MRIATMSSGEAQDLMAEIARIAPAKQHRLSADMVDGRRQLSIASARMTLEHLRRCPDKADVSPAAIEAARGAQPRPGDTAGAQDASLPRLESFKDIPKGYYATPSATGTNDLDFWRVRKGKPGTRWDGFSFAARILGGGDGSSMRTVNLSNIQQRLALQAIRLAGTEAAAMMFAAKIKRCRDCGLALTDEVSRAAGRGPDCRDKASRKGAA